MCIGLCTKLLLLRAVNALDVALSYTACAHTLPACELHCSPEDKQRRNCLIAAVASTHARSHLIDVSTLADPARGIT